MAKRPYNLGYKFGGDLRALPDDRASMQAYVDFLLAEVKLIANPPPLDRIRALVKFLGEIGAYANILMKPQMAIKALEKSLVLIDEHGLGNPVWAAHTLRYGDALRFSGDRLGAETAFRSVLEMVKRSKDIAEYEDFAWQHLGKLHFEAKEWPEAEACFGRALDIRRRKGQKELIESTEVALRVLKMKKPPV